MQNGDRALKNKKRKNVRKIYEISLQEVEGRYVRTKARLDAVMLKPRKAKAS